MLLSYSLFCNFNTINHDIVVTNENNTSENSISSDSDLTEDEQINQTTEYCFFVESIDRVEGSKKSFLITPPSHSPWQPPKS